MDRALRAAAGRIRERSGPGLGWGVQRERRGFRPYSREVRGKKKKKASPAHSTDPAWGGMLLPGSLHHPLGGKTPTRDGILPAELFPASPQQHRAVMGTLGRRRLGKALLPSKCRQLHSQTRKMRHRIFAGGCISRFLSCPNNRLSMLKPFLEAQLYITFRFIDRVCRTQNKQGGCISSEKSAGREGTQLKRAQKKIMPKEEPFLQSRHEKKYCQVAIHSYFK